DLDTELMKARDEKQHHRADHQPCPAWQLELLLDAVDLVMQDERRYAECQAENGDAAQRDRHIDHALAPHRLEDEQAQHAIDEEEQPENVLGRREIAEGCLENGRGLPELGKDIGGKAYQASPDHPVQPLLILRGLVSPPNDQDCKGDKIDDEAG